MYSCPWFSCSNNTSVATDFSAFVIVFTLCPLAVVRTIFPIKTVCLSY